jgi:hypothetical protein
VSIALAPVFEADWTAETQTYHSTGPVFDSDGNLYAVPYLSHEPVALVALDPADGSRSERRFPELRGKWRRGWDSNPRTPCEVT